jgi:hypothetical protein
LQSIVSMHEKNSLSQIQTPKPLPVLTSSMSSGRRRVRKPDKSAICHVVPEMPVNEPEVILEVDYKEETTLKQILNEEPLTAAGTAARLSPEVTITATGNNKKQDMDGKILRPEEYRKLGMPIGYIFWPNANVFVHPSVLQGGGQVDLISSVPQTPKRHVESMESLSGVMRVRPQKPVRGSNKDFEQKHHQGSNDNAGIGRQKRSSSDVGAVVSSNSEVSFF